MALRRSACRVAPVLQELPPAARFLGGEAFSLDPASIDDVAAEDCEPEHELVTERLQAAS